MAAMKTGQRMRILLVNHGTAGEWGGGDGVQIRERAKGFSNAATKWLVSMPINPTAAGSI